MGQCLGYLHYYYYSCSTTKKKQLKEEFVLAHGFGKFSPSWWGKHEGVQGGGNFGSVFLPLWVRKKRTMEPGAKYHLLLLMAFLTS